MPIIKQRYEQVAVSKLKPHPRNPNKGNVGVIAESIEANGFYGAVVAQESTGLILVGNHRWKGAKQVGEKTVPVIWLDVDDETALRVMLVDNRAATMSSTDTQLLADVLQSIQNPQVGTGFTEDDIDMILSAIEDSSVDLSSVITAPPSFGAGNVQSPMGDEDMNTEFGQESTVRDIEIDQVEDDVDYGTEFSKTSEEVPGAFGLKADVQFEFTGTWQIPPLRNDMLMSPDELLGDPINGNLLAWAGSATANWDNEDQWWLYNYGVDSTSGMRDISKCIVSFFTWDKYFELWWDYPDRYVGKCLNSGIKYAITPDFSTWDTDPRCFHMFQIYRQRWMGRYFQEAGIKLIPHVTWPGGDDWELENIILPTLPKKVPLLAIQLQTFDPRAETEASIEQMEYMTRMALTYNKPDLVLLYSGTPGRDWLESLNIGPDIFYVANRNQALSARHKDKSKKTTL
jgi:hypothetical protein